MEVPGFLLRHSGRAVTREVKGSEQSKTIDSWIVLVATIGPMSVDVLSAAGRMFRSSDPMNERSHVWLSGLRGFQIQP